MKAIFNRYTLITIILDNMQITYKEDRLELRECYSKFNDSTLLENFSMFYCIRKVFYTTN